MGALSPAMALSRSLSASGSLSDETSMPWDLTMRVAVESSNITGTEALLMTVSEMNDSINSDMASRNSRNRTLSE